MSAPRTFPGYAVGPALHKPGSPAQRPARMLNIAPDVDRVTVKVTDHGAEFAVTLDRDMAEDAGHALINAAAGERTDEALEPWEHASEPPSREWLDEVRQALQEPMAASRGHKRTLRACRRLYDALMAVSADQPGNAAAPAERKQPVMPEAVTAAAQWWAGRLHARYADRYDAFLAALDQRFAAAFAWGVNQFEVKDYAGRRGFAISTPILAAMNDAGIPHVGASVLGGNGRMALTDDGHVLRADDLTTSATGDETPTVIIWFSEAWRTRQPQAGVSKAQLATYVPESACDAAALWWAMRLAPEHEAKRQMFWRALASRMMASGPSGLEVGVWPRFVSVLLRLALHDAGIAAGRVVDTSEPTAALGGEAVTVISQDTTLVRALVGNGSTVIWNRDDPKPMATPAAMTSGAWQPNERLHLADDECHANTDGECEWRKCPQATDHKPTCPLAKQYEES